MRNHKNIKQTIIVFAGPLDLLILDLRSSTPGQKKHLKLCDVHERSENDWDENR